MTTGQRIKKARKQANMTQSELAMKLDIPFQSISQWERDVRNPKLETLQRIADALLVPLSSLLDQTAQEAYEKGVDIATAAHDYLDNLTNELWKEYGYSGSEAEVQLVKAFSQLNPDGQAKAVERVEELTEIPKYQKEKPPQD